MPTYGCLDAAFAATVRLLLEHGVVVAPRGSETRELLCVEFRLETPRARRITIPVRRWNEALAVGELCWHMSGADDVESLAYYAEPWREFSDDGQHILGSCYGRKIFEESNTRGSQWDRAKALLVGDPDTRRAVLTLGDDAEDARWRDVACLREIQFILRNNQLHCVATMRSNDVIWGLGYDVFFITMLQERMAAEIGTGMGWYVHRANSMHLYRRHYELADEIVASPSTEGHAMSPMEYLEQIPDFLSVERTLRLNQQVVDSSLATYWKDLALPLFKFAAAKHGRRPSALSTTV